MTHTVLSTEIQRELEELCTKFGSAQVARENPEEVLLPLLKELNRDKRSVSAMVISTLESAISQNAVEYRRREKQRRTKAA